MKGTAVEIKIGIQQTAREIVLESADSQEEIAKQVATVLEKGGVLSLVDEKGRQVIVPGEKLAYVEIGVTTSRKVGFGG